MFICIKFHVNVYPILILKTDESIDKQIVIGKFFLLCKW